MDFSPEWMTWEIEQALARLPLRKQRTTVLRLAAAKVEGHTQAHVFERKDCCSRTTWYGRYKHGEKIPGWQDDPDIQGALKLATERAQHWQDSYIARQIGQTMKDLARHGPGAVKVLSDLMTSATSESIKRLSALDILDRLGAGEVASKATVPTTSDGKSIIQIFTEQLGQIVQMSEDEFTNFAGPLPDLRPFGTLEETAEVEG